MGFFSLTFLQEEGYICWYGWKLLCRPAQRDVKVHHIHFLESFHWSFCLSFTQGNLHIFYFFDTYSYHLFPSYKGFPHLSGKLSAPESSKRAWVHIAWLKGSSLPLINLHHPFLLQTSVGLLKLLDYQNFLPWQLFSTAGLFCPTYRVGLEVSRVNVYWLCTWGYVS